MKKMFACVSVMFFVMSMVSGKMVFGQEEAKHSCGTVASVSGDNITVSEFIYSETSGEEAYQDVIYTVSKDAELDNIPSLEVLKDGVEVDIEYVEKEGKKEASYIFVYDVGGE